MTTLAPELHEPSSADAKVQQSAPSPDPLALILQTATLLFANAETTERTLRGANRVAESLGYRTTLIPRWDELTLLLEDNSGFKIDVARVAPTMQPKPGIQQKKVSDFNGANRDRTGDLLNAIQGSNRARPITWRATSCNQRDNL